MTTTAENGSVLYAKFIEHNEHEGETWNFYIPVEDNEETLQVLGAKVAEITMVDGEPMDPLEYELADGYLTEFEVDVLVEHANDDTSYMAAHTKLEGLLDADQVAERSDFYKSGIKDCMRQPGPGEA